MKNVSSFLNKVARNVLGEGYFCHKLSSSDAKAINACEDGGCKYVHSGWYLHNCGLEHELLKYPFYLGKSKVDAVNSIVEYSKR